ncbi:MAG: PAS domain-containing protein [Chloroflexi bacterium]|nr:PAS domain-containing protein [Chloroflexota bacterium]
MDLPFLQDPLTEEPDNICRFWSYFVRPAASLPPEEQRRARFVSAIFFTLTILYTLGETVRILITRTVGPHFPWAVLGLWLVYALSRTPYYRWASRLGVTLLGVIAWVSLATAPDPGLPVRPWYLLSVVQWLIYPLLLSALLAPPWATLGFGLVNLFVVVAIAHTRGWGWEDIKHAIMFLTGFQIFVLFVSMFQHRFTTMLQRQTRQLSRQRVFLTHLLNSITEPLYIIDAKTYQIILANEKAKEMGIHLHPQSPVYCYALTHRRETPCDQEDGHPCPLRQVREQKSTAVVEHVHYRADGTPYYVEVRGYPVLDDDGNVRFMIEYAIDITARKMAEAQIRKLARAVEHAAHGIVITNADGIIEYVNPAFTRITGYEPEEVIGRTPRLLRSGYHTPEFYRELWETITQGRVWRGEIINRRKNGEIYYEFQTIAPVMDENGRITHYVAIKQDITEYKQMQQQLEEAKRRAEQALHFKQAFLASVSHDMRTPLGAIVGYVDMLREGVFGPVTREQQERLNAIAQAAQQLLEMVNDLLLQAELESATLKIQRERVSLDKLLLSSRAVLLSQAQRKGLELRLERDPNLPPVIWGDFRLLRSILNNLISNAIRYTPRGWVHVRLYRVDKDHWAIEVRDTGIGMSKEQILHIFEPFYTTGERNRTGIPSAGLGLAIVRQLVEALGGRIEVQSEPGKGSVFTVILPLEPAPAGDTDRLSHDLIAEQHGVNPQATPTANDAEADRAGPSTGGEHHASGMANVGST